MNTSLFSNDKVYAPRAYQNIQHAREQGKHWAQIEAEWNADHLAPAKRQPIRVKALFSRLLAFVTAPTNQFAIDSRR
jgi:hypothetical protein